MHQYHLDMSIDNRIASLRDLAEESRRLMPPRRAELLVLAFGFTTSSAPHPITGRVSVKADIDSPALNDALNALAPCVRYHAASHTQYALHVAMDGFDLETGIHGVELDVPALIRHVAPRAVLFLTGDTSKTWDGTPLSTLLGHCVHAGLTVYHHSTTQTGIEPCDPIVEQQSAKEWSDTTDAVLNRRVTAQRQEFSELLTDGRVTSVPTGRVAQLAGEWKPKTLGGLPVYRFDERRWLADEQPGPWRTPTERDRLAGLKQTTARFGSCVYWNVAEMKTYGVAHLIPEGYDEDRHVLKFNLCPKLSDWEVMTLERDDPKELARMQPLRFEQVRDDYWRNLLGQGILYGVYRQQVRQYVERVIGRWHDGFARTAWEHNAAIEMERRDADVAISCHMGRPECSEPFDRTSSGYWDRRDRYVNTGCVESKPRMWVDLSAYLEAGPTCPVEPGQHAASRVKPWEEASDLEASDGDDEFCPSILAWQDEYDRIGSWSAEGTSARPLTPQHMELMWVKSDMKGFVDPVKCGVWQGSECDPLEEPTWVPTEAERFHRRMFPTIDDRAAHLGSQGIGREAKVIKLQYGDETSVKVVLDRSPDLTAAWIEHLLDATDRIRELIPRVETCRFATKDDVMRLPEAEWSRQPDDLESLAEALATLGTNPKEANDRFRELDAQANQFVGPVRCQRLSLWGEFIAAGKQVRRVLALRAEYLADPEAFTKRELLSEALFARPEWEPIVQAARPGATRMRETTRSLARRTIEGYIRQRRKEAAFDRRVRRRIHAMKLKVNRSRRLAKCQGQPT